MRLPVRISSRSAPKVLRNVETGLRAHLALKSALPRLLMVAGLSANHLAALRLPAARRRRARQLDEDRGMRLKL
jgi:hypothetical protein